MPVPVGPDLRGPQFWIFLDLEWLFGLGGECRPQILYDNGMSVNH